MLGFTALAFLDARRLSAGEPLGAREFALALARSLAFVLPAFPCLTVRPPTDGRARRRGAVPRRAT